MLVRYSFPGRRVVDALVDLRFALPTAVAGITLAANDSGNGWIGQLFEPYGVDRLHSARRAGRTGLHRLAVRGANGAAGAEELEPELEEQRPRSAQAGCRPSPGGDLSDHPAALLTGFALAFARAIGEQGRSSSSRGIFRWSPRSRRC